MGSAPWGTRVSSIRGRFPRLPTGVPLEGDHILHLNVITADEVIEHFDEGQQVEAEVDPPDDLGVDLAGA